MLYDLKPVSETDSGLELMVWRAALIREGGNAVVITSGGEVLEGPVSSDGSVEPSIEEFIPADRSDPDVKRAMNALFKRLVPDPGDQLSNGARVLDATHTGRHRAVVAAKYDGQYVTWRLNVQTGGAAFGNYFPGPTEKFVEDYKLRAQGEPEFSITGPLDLSDSARPDGAKPVAGA